MVTDVSMSRGRRGEILEAAIELLASGGERAVTYTRIDRAAGAPTGTGSNHYRSMDKFMWAVCAEVQVRRAVEWNQLLAPAITGAGVAVGDFAELLANYVTDACSTHGTSGKLARAHHALMVIAHHRPVLRTPLAEADRKHVALLHDALHAVNPSASPCDAELVSTYLYGAIGQQHAIPSALFNPHTGITALLTTLT